MVLGLWFESTRATFLLSEISNALPVPMPRQVFSFISESKLQLSGLPSRRFRMEGITKSIYHGSRL